MLIQLLIGIIATFLSTVSAGFGYLVLESLIKHTHNWFANPPHNLKILVLFCGSVTWLLMVALANVSTWVLIFVLLDIFDTLEEAVYFAVVAFTTLGFGDILLPQEWRLLAGIAAINGLLMIGCQTAILIEVMRNSRMIQAQNSNTESWPRY